jgi:hypothetical protein
MIKNNRQGFRKRSGLKKTTRGGLPQTSVLGKAALALDGKTDFCPLFPGLREKTDSPRRAVGFSPLSPLSFFKPTEF